MTDGTRGLTGLGALLSPACWNDLLGCGTTRRYPPDHTLMWEGGPGQAIHVLRRGRVKVQLSVADGFGMPLAVRYPGEVLGEISVLGGSTRTATVVAIDACDVRVVPAQRFQWFITRHGLHPLIYRFSWERLQESERFRAELVALPFVQRLCRTLLTHAVPDGPDRWVVNLRMSQEELGRMCGGCRASMSGALKTLRGQGIVATAPREITVLDMPGLRRYARHGAPGDSAPARR
ncbi:Crp/Fnr family transcriptional regulator [Streptomyces sp. URMC 129]|uniref:Crp/Fnr family transcriptional regulator n=1 Tax=Streptomyces sp. URMC 129 TaxID=3423407 RepID=UPI003F197DF4